MTELDLQPAADPRGLVLIVDDEARNRTLFRDLLEADGHRVLESADGEEALERARMARPDVILLDVMMPRLDGFEVCRRLKASALAHVPVLLVTSLSERSERLKGIEAGANDFITKPVDTADLLLRVRNAVASKHLFDQTASQYQQLQKMEEMRDSLVHMIVHDLRSPLTGLMGYLELLKQETEGKLDEQAESFIDEARSIASRLREMTSTVLDVSRMEAGVMPISRIRFDLDGLIMEALRILGPEAVRRVRYARRKTPARLWCDREVLRRVVVNLVGNALKFSEPGSPVRISVESAEQDITVAISDSGPGIAPKVQARIFDKFVQGDSINSPELQSSGLGLTFCKLAVEAHGGRIWVESQPGVGSTFSFRIPRGAQTPHSPAERTMATNPR